MGRGKMGKGSTRFAVMSARCQRKKKFFRDFNLRWFHPGLLRLSADGGCERILGTGSGAAYSHQALASLATRRTSSMHTVIPQLLLFLGCRADAVRFWTAFSLSGGGLGAGGETTREMLSLIHI